MNPDTTEDTYSAITRMCLSCGLHKHLSAVKCVPGQPTNAGVCLECVRDLVAVFGPEQVLAEVVVLRKDSSGRWPRRPANARQVLYV